MEVLTDARRQGAMTAAITAERHSPLAAQADHTLMLKTGAEKAVAATKTFTASLAVLASLSAAIEQSTGAHHPGTGAARAAGTHRGSNT